jgi:hypothetical protein
MYRAATLGRGRCGPPTRSNGMVNASRLPDGHLDGLDNMHTEQATLREGLTDAPAVMLRGSIGCHHHQGDV